MRKIDKTTFFATAFAENIANFVINNGKHPEYNSTANEFYIDVYYNLLYCQKGLCAYTEDLIDETIWKEVYNNWVNGKYIGQTANMDADLEHFNPKLKDKLGWSFENLFLVRLYTNRKIKLGKEVFDFFKPDDADYSPEKYLEYNFETHLFLPLEELDAEMFKKVDYMIETLGINAHSVKESRRCYLTDIQHTMNYNFIDYDTYRNKRLNRFFTAYEMSKMILRNDVK